MSSIVAKLIGPFRRLTAEELISLIKRSAAKVESCASNLRDDMIVGNFWVAKDVQKTSQVIQVNVEEINDGMSIVDQRLMQLQERQHYMSQQLEDAMTSQNGLFDVLQDFVFGKYLLSRCCISACKAQRSFRGLACAGLSSFTWSAPEPGTPPE